MRAFNAIAEIAEDEGHHPDLHLFNYRDVKVSTHLLFAYCRLPEKYNHLQDVLQIVLSTHATGGLSINDFIMAAKIDAVPVEYSPKWLKSQQTS